jgi:hypothetical protein
MVPEFGRKIWHKEAAKLYGSLSAGEAASQLSLTYHMTVTRNAVIGYWHRLQAHHALHGEPLPSLKGKQIERRSRRLSAPAPKKPSRQIVSRSISAPLVRNCSVKSITAPARDRISIPHDADPSPGPDALSFFDMPLEGRCRFPYGDPSDLETFRFCGQTSGIHIYCEAHKSLAYARSQPKGDKQKKNVWNFRAKKKWDAA